MAFSPIPTNNADNISSDGIGDFIAALGGNDSVFGNGGNDTLDGGDGSDALSGGDGDDLLRGGGGPVDTMRGDAGNDILIGGAGGNAMFGGSGNDVFIRGGVLNQFFGDEGYDIELASGVGRRGATFSLEGGTSTRNVQGVRDTYTGVEVVQYADGREVFDLNDPAAQVVRLYQAALGRAPEQFGQNFWDTKLQAGQGSLADLAQGFLNSVEFVGRFGNNLDNQTLMVRLYENVLGRAPDQAGLTDWVNTLNAGETRASVLARFSESGENVSRTAPFIQAGVWDLSEHAAQVARLYDTTFGRVPDVTGLQAWREQLDAGSQSLLDVTTGFVNSSEFVSRYGAAVDTGSFVELLYQNTLHRASDAAGKQGWVNALDAGVYSRAQVVIGFSESTEHQFLTSGNILNENPGQFGILFAG
ncbi:DUF4214 domain-containing protein [Muricoccus vinaceus]|jgi:hypothetical protein|uniref:DUF4214 domain-containing protein n=1 Tax=Muricoccus vinaceus TaxID=424704 RepID=A0ABV6IXP8_9PROT